MHVYVLTCVWDIMPHSCQKIPLCFLCLFQALAEEIKAMHGLQLNTKVPSEKSWIFVSYKHTSWDHLIMFFTRTPCACLFLKKVCISLHTCMSVCEHAYERRDCNRLIWWQWPAFLLRLWHYILTCMNVMADFLMVFLFVFVFTLCIWGVVFCVCNI